VTHSIRFDRLRAVLFDMDGLMVDTEPIHFAAFREYMRRHGVELPESVMSELIGYTEQDNLRELKAKYGIAASLEEMIAERREIYLELVRRLPIEVFPGFWEFSAAARERGMKQAVVSSAAAAQVELVLDRLFEARPDLAPPGAYFEAIVSGDEIARNKPAPDIYLEGARRLAAPPAWCLALEDSPPGAQAAAGAGMLVVAVPNRYTQGLAFPGAQAVVLSLEAARSYLGW
jgi:beta-phosphoglucomutase-like phosphatase (HAD superfamily)